MIEITEEIRKWIDMTAEQVEPDADEYRSPDDGLLHCKQCRGRRQTVVPRFGRPGYFTPRVVCACQQAAIDAKREEEERQQRMESIRRKKHRACKTRICVSTPLLMTMGKIL